MAIAPIKSFTIDTESEADEYLNDLFREPKYRSMTEVDIRAHKYIRNDNLRRYFLAKAAELLKTVV
jgi:hypothetical protein